ncbi:hypothetical protein SISNIDRAFT_458161 [Sistotremastrum niveocremeum HHB9708]|uniref:Uncharacterized protein n=2 Tax=Sistotremastraceae TaxID=3402574 RepID=A0A164R2Z3_9AGAM|nr:hypothetical protein SISNIDRAFT_458161 [Sistotremastrum niveocremeum HHB9708]KZT35258.1 hypothetical protein SISSUDRAFT_1051656 [Sistotremastrum suecicum HHB10207 ss-3]
MCQRVMTGQKYVCGHFIPVQVAATIDCGNRRCEKSINHPDHCHRVGCTTRWGPDKEQIVETVAQRCRSCESFEHGHADRR